MKSYKNQNEELDKAIDLLELQRELKFKELKNQLSVTYESVKPINLVKQSISEFKESTELKSNLIETVLSLSGGLISKKLMVGKSKSIFKKILGSVIQFGVTSFIAKKVHVKEE